MATLITDVKVVLTAPEGDPTAPDPQSQAGAERPVGMLSPAYRAATIGIVAVMTMFAFEGIGVATGSVMTGNTIWAVLGAACFVAGVLVLRRKPRPAPQDGPEPQDPAPADLESPHPDSQDPQPPASA